MSISYNYFLPTNIYGTLSVTDLSFVGYTAVNANIYCQRNINCDGQLQCGQFHSLGTSYFDQIPTCILNATLPTQLTNYQTVEALIAGGGGASILILNNTWSGTNTFQIAIISSGSGLLANTIPATSIQNQTINQNQIAVGYFLMSNTNQSFGGVKTFTVPIISSGASITVNTIPALSLVNNSITNTQIAAGFLLITTSNQSFSGIKTFISPIISSGASIILNTIPALSLVDNSITNNQIAVGFQLINNLNQSFMGIKTFISPIVSSGESITINTIPALSLVDNSITNTQIATGFQLITNTTQTIIGDKIFNGSNTANDMIINIRSIVPGNLYNNTISFLPACDLYYLNLSTANFDSVMLIGQPISNGIDQEYAFNICSYNSGLSGIRISGNGSPNNCNVVISGTQTNRDLLTLNDGLLINSGNIDIPQAIYAGTIACDFFINRLNDDIFFQANNFTTYSVTSGNSSILPTSGIEFGGVSIGYNCSNSVGETDFINLANYSLSGGFNFYTMNAFTVPSLIATLNTTGLTMPGSLTNNKIINSSSTLPYIIETPQTTVFPTATDGIRALKIGWNGQPGQGETDFINCSQGGQGGFSFSVTNMNFAHKLLSTMNIGGGGLRLYPDCGKIQLDDINNGAFNTVINHGDNQSVYISSGINGRILFQCGDATSLNTNSMLLTSSINQPLVNFSPASTTSFNVSHPTTTLPQPTLTNQYATVGYVNSQITSPNLLPLNNTWTGTNFFYNPTRLINIGSAIAPISVGSGTANALNIILGDSSSLSTISASGGNIAISTIGAPTMTLTTGSNNHCIGGGCLTSLTTGSNNLVFGSGSGTSLISGSNNVIIGAGSWQSNGGAFNNCTVLGSGAVPFTSNQVVLGTVAETVIISGACNSNNTLLSGTTVCTGDNLQVNNQIKRSHGTYTTGVATTFLNPLPYMILFTPIAGQSFILPIPSATNSGQTFIIRKRSAGGGQNINFSCTGSPSVWVPLNSGTAATSITISTTWQFTYYSTGSAYIAIS